MRGRFANDPFSRATPTVGLAGRLRYADAGVAGWLPTSSDGDLQPGDSFTFSPLVFCMPTCRCSTPVARRATTPSDTSWATQSFYSTPAGGLSANVHYQFGEVAGDSGPGTWASTCSLQRTVRRRVLRA